MVVLVEVSICELEVKLMALPLKRSNNEPSSRDPFRDLFQLQSLFSDWAPFMNIEDSFVPLGDLEEQDDAYLLEVELPAVDKKDINIEVSNRRVAISGERREKERKGVLRHKTRLSGKFSYELTLPGEVDQDNIEANLKDGVLSVRIPKAAHTRPRRIEIG